VKRQSEFLIFPVEVFFMGTEFGIYIGTKIIQAREMTENEFADRTGRPTAQDNRPGYLVVYPDGYESWSPKDSFDGAYRLISEQEIKLINPNAVIE
jgi:hypothetical protein